MAQGNKVCGFCKEVGHSKFYCPTRPKKAIQNKKPLKASRAASTRGSTVTKSITRKKRTKTRGQLVKELDSAFSQYIRLKDAVDGLATCVTCGTQKEWKLLQNGHYESRGKFPTRWDEENCHVQCYACNVAMKGNYTSYARYMVNRYGAGKLEELHIKATSGTKIPTPVLRDLIQEYKKKVEELL